MANQEHLDILKQGVKTWNKWREKHPDIQPDLSEAHLEGADLREAHQRHLPIFEGPFSIQRLSLTT